RDTFRHLNNAWDPAKINIMHSFCTNKMFDSSPILMLLFPKLSRTDLNGTVVFERRKQPITGSGELA
ncbi:MAG: hypothetical protein N2385_12315, partial [Chloroflexus sp.]|nr:hypothetical protein [Chloroflexus sp.]